MSSKFKVEPFASLPIDEYKKIRYYCEIEKAKVMKQVLGLLKNDIGRNQKRKVLDWINNIEAGLKQEYEVVDSETCEAEKALEKCEKNGE